MILAYTFCDYDYAGKMAENMRDFQRSPSALMLTVETRFIEGLTAIALLRRAIAPGANRKVAKSALKRLSKWAKGSPRSFTAKQKILQAEFLSLKPRVSADRCMVVYQAAIDAAVEEGYIRDAAIAHERAGDFKLTRGDTAGAIDHWRRAICLYNEWGATAKSVQLQAYTLLK